MTINARIIGELVDQLKAQQSSLAGPEIHFSHDPTGFGAQVSRRNLALRIGFIAGRRVLFPDESMFPYLTPYRPLGATNSQPAYSGYFGQPEIEAKNYNFDFWKFWESKNEKAAIYDFAPHSLLDRAENVQVLFDGILSSCQELKPEWAAAVDDEITRLQIPSRYIGVHFRRGDKSVETPYLSIDAYRSAIQSVAQRTGVSTVYLASDSPEAPTLLRLTELGLEVVFDDTEKRYDNANHRFLAQNQELAHQETLTALKTIEILSRATRIVGQDNAHFATIAAGRIATRENGHFGILLDGKMRLSDPRIAAIYKLKGSVRAIGKRLLPMLSVKSRRKG